MFLKRAILGIGTSLVSLACLAGATSGAIHVNITMTRHSGICLSETLSAGVNASVWVVCETGQFVDITPVPGRPFAGVHGGAYRYNFSSGQGYVPASNSADPFAGAGTVTALRIYNADSSDGPLELLVSF